MSESGETNRGEGKVIIHHDRAIYELVSQKKLDALPERSCGRIRVRCAGGSCNPGYIHRVADGSAMIFPEHESLYMQLDWYAEKLKPWMESKTLSYWVSHPQEYKWAKGIENHYVKAIEVLQVEK